MSLENTSGHTFWAHGTPQAEKEQPGRYRSCLRREGPQNLAYHWLSSGFMAAGWLEQKQSVLPAWKEGWGPKATGIPLQWWWDTGSSVVVVVEGG